MSVHGICWSGSPAALGGRQEVEFPGRPSRRDVSRPGNRRGSGSSLRRSPPCVLSRVVACTSPGLADHGRQRTPAQAQVVRSLRYVDLPSGETPVGRGRSTRTGDPLPVSRLPERKRNVRTPLRAGVNAVVVGVWTRQLELRAAEMRPVARPSTPARRGRRDGLISPLCDPWPKFAHASDPGVRFRSAEHTSIGTTIRHTFDG